MINTAFLSIIRTASVSGLMIQNYDSARPLHKIKVGIIGWGPIGQYHCKMCHEMFGNKINRTYVYDLRKIEKDSLHAEYGGKVVVCDNWQAAYTEADLVITCTVAQAPYITLKPKTGSFHLNVSLRDYTLEVFEHFKDAIVVDSWEEACRENTDIEKMHLEKGLQKADVKTIIDVVLHDAIRGYAPATSVFFNPMGMAVFDIALASFYYRKAFENRVGVQLS
jgi:ornithine cyclodeaminase